MTDSTGDRKQSSCVPDAFQNYHFAFLPIGQTGDGAHRTVATVYFATDQPLKRAREEGKRIPRDFFLHPGSYLTSGDRNVLKDLFDPVDGGRDGSRTRDPAKAVPNVPSSFNVPFRELFVELTHVSWVFNAYADPRESTQYNYELGWARATVVVSSMMQYLWDGFGGSGVPTTEEMVQNLLKLYRAESYSFESWRRTHLEPLNSDDKWRAATVLHIMNGLMGRSWIAGDLGLDPDHLPRSRWPTMRRVEIKVNSAIGSAEHDYTTDCSVFSKERKYYQASDSRELPAVIDPGSLYDFEPSSQTEETWDPRTRPDDLTPEGNDNMLLQFLEEVVARQKQRERAGTGDAAFAAALTRILYGFRYVRLVQHELLRGNVPPTTGPGPGWTNPGTDTIARSSLCEEGVYGLGDIWDDMIPNDLGHFIFGGNIIDNTAGIKQARQIAHLYWIRVDPWYRSAYVKEIPASSPSDTWLDSDTVAEPPEEVDLWPGADDVASLPEKIRAHLNPKQWGDERHVTGDDAFLWGNGIPKPLGRDAEDGPVGYMSGEEHYRWLAENGHYTYDGLSYLNRDNGIVTSEWRHKLPKAYGEKNDYDPRRSYLRNVRDAMKEGMILMEMILTDDQWNTWLAEERRGYPNYDEEWDTWKDPTQDPYLGS